MPKTEYKSVDEYISAQPETSRAMLEQVRNSIRKAVPNAEEVLSYQMPTYKLNGHAVIYFAGWKQHFSLYPATAGVVEEFGDDLSPYEISKGTIRFPLSTDVPAGLITRIAKHRAREVTARSKAEGDSKKPPKGR